MPEFKAHFKSAQPDLGGSLPGNLIFGIPGEAGGYYTIQITQPDKHTMRLTFIPSKQNMEQIAPVDIILPKGPEGAPAQIDMEKIRQFVIDYLTANPPQVVESDPTVPSWAKQPEKPSYSKSEVGLDNVDNVRQYSASNPPPYPVASVNGKTGKVQLGAADVGARPSSWMPTAQEVGALPDTYVPPNQTAAQVGADPAGTAAAAVSAHNTSTESHGDLRLELKAISDRLTAFFDSDNQTLDELSEIVAYITSNKALIDSITTSKVSVVDIINNLTTNVANKPLSAAQGVVLKGLIDAVSSSLSNYQPKGDYALRSELPTVPTKVSQLQNDKGYLTEHQDISGKLDADKLPEAVNTALAQAKESGEFDGEKGDPGYTPQKEKDYWTYADREAIIDEVTSQLSLKILNQMTLGYHTDGLLYLFVNGAPVGTGVEFIGGATGDVTGVIDSVNNIILTGVDGDLPDGTYSIKYEKEDGTLVDGGNLVISSGPKYTNLLPTSIDNTGAVYNGMGYKDGYRLTGGAYPCESAGTEYFCTGYIPYTKAQASARVPMYVKGITIDTSNVPKYLRVLMVDAYNTTDSYIDTLNITGDSGASNQITIQQLGDKYYKLTPNSGFISGNFDDWKNKDLQFIRWSFPGTGKGVIFTVDEPIE